MSIERVQYFVNRYAEVGKDISLIEANKRALKVCTLVLVDRFCKIIFDVLWKFEKEPNKSGRVLLIESTNRWNWWWLWDGIFKTPAIADMANSWIRVDIITHESRKDIFLHNPNINEIYTLDWGRLNFLKLSIRLRLNNYAWILSFYPDTNRPLLVALIWATIKKYTWPKNTKYMLTTNHIDAYRQVVQNNIPNISKWDWKTLITLSNEEINEAKKILTKKSDKIYIWISIWWKSKIRNFKKWKEVITKLNELYWNRIVFVLYWKDNTLWIDTEIQETFSNIINLVWKTSTLRQQYWIINEMDLNVWMDWWNINASIALWRPTIPIYNIVRWINRVPEWFDESMIIQWWCNIWYCWEMDCAGICIPTKQLREDHYITPPCLDDTKLLEEIIEKVGKQILLILSGN